MRMLTRKPDRRGERTRRALMDAFSELVLSVGYDRLTVRDVIERAKVGRSTFYEHFDDKQDVLRRSVAPVLAPLAATVTNAAAPAALDAMIAHFHDHRRLLRAFFDGPARALLVGFLAELIEDRLDRMRDAAPLIPLPMIAAQLAEAQLGLIRAWIDDPQQCDIGSLTAALTASTRAAAAALLRPALQRTSEPNIPRAASTAAATAGRR